MKTHKQTYTHQNRRFYPVLFLLSALVVLTGCRTTEIVQVRITPTADIDTVVVDPTAGDPNGIAQVPTMTTGTVVPAEDATVTPEPETPTQTPLPETPVNFFGPIVGTDYVPPDIDLPGRQTFEDIPTTTPTPLPPTPRPDITVTPTLTPPPLLDASVMGLQVYSNVDFDNWMRVIGLSEVTGVEWIKVQVNWDFLQPEGAEVFGQNLQLFERQIEALKRPGFNILLSIAKAPDWARSNLQESGPPDNPEDLANFIRFLLNDTKIGGVIDAIEVWNEPNLVREWQGNLPFNGGGYMQLFAPSYAAIREFSADIVIVTAGLAPTGTVDGATVDDRVFLQQMYDNGLANYPDVVIGAHPYGWANAPDARCCAAQTRGWDDSPYFFFLDNLEATYNVMENNDDGDRQIWVTEFGWSTWEGFSSPPPEPWVAFNTIADQAIYNIRAFEIGQELPYVGVMFLWNLNFANEAVINSSNEIAGYSLIVPPLFPSERPGYWLLGQATGAVAP